MVGHLDDLEADFRAFYRLTPADIAELTGPHFLALAVRTMAYPGVMAARAAAEQDETPRGGSTADRAVDSTPLALQNDPALSDVFDYG